VWGRESHYKIPYKPKVIKKLMSALPCSKKGESKKERIMKKREKVEKRR